MHRAKKCKGKYNNYLISKVLKVETKSNRRSLNVQRDKYSDDSKARIMKGNKNIFQRPFYEKIVLMSN